MDAIITCHLAQITSVYTAMNVPLIISQNIAQETRTEDAPQTRSQFLSERSTIDLTHSSSGRESPDSFHSESSQASTPEPGQIPPRPRWFLFTREQIAHLPEHQRRILLLMHVPRYIVAGRSTRPVVRLDRIMQDLLDAMPILYLLSIQTRTEETLTTPTSMERSTILSPRPTSPDPRVETSSDNMRNRDISGNEGDNVMNQEDEEYFAHFQNPM